jgi:hypothetical protein
MEATVAWLLLCAFRIGQLFCTWWLYHLFHCRQSRQNNPPILITKYLKHMTS